VVPSFREFRPALTAVLIVLIVVSSGCGGSSQPARETPAPTPASAATPLPAPELTPTAAETPGAEAASPDAESTPFEVKSYGVPECDAYVKQYLACIEGRVPEEQRAGWLASLEANRVRWNGLAAMQQGSLALKLACKAASQVSKEALAVDYGCEF